LEYCGSFDVLVLEPFLLVAHWLGGSSKATDDLEEYELKTMFPGYLLHFEERRVGKLRERVLAGFAGPLLSAPTHEGGWIDPTILVERWQEIERLEREPDPLDVIQALLRLAPDRRSDALNAAKQLSHRSAAALRWALGGDEARLELDTDREPVWVAAARARVPQGDVPGTEKWTGQTAGGVCAARMPPEAVPAIESKPQTAEQKAVLRSFRNEVLKAAADMPTVVLLNDRGSWADMDPRIVEWISITWPGNADLFFGGGLAAMVAPHALHEPDRPWGDRSRTAVILATAADEQDFRRLAIDALIDGIGDGRVLPRALGETLSRIALSSAATCAELKQLSTRVDELAKGNRIGPEAAEELARLAASLSSKSADLKPLSKSFAASAKVVSQYELSKRQYKDEIEKIVASKTFKLNRLCAAFSEVSRVSPLHAWVIAGTIEILLGSYESLPDDVHHLSSLLLEPLTQLGLAPGDDVRAKLATIKGGGKTASLAKSLAALEPQQTSAAAEARVICAEKRMERAARWSNGQTRSATTG
jgi:hypothetical protein